LQSVKKNLAVPYSSNLTGEKLEARQKEDNEAREKLKSQKVILYSNIAACHLMKKDYPKTKEYCEKVIYSLFYSMVVIFLI
jgi:hypothetical protein